MVVLSSSVQELGCRWERVQVGTDGGVKGCAPSASRKGG